MRKFIIRIGYTDYMVEPRDAVALLEIASRMKHVKQSNYTGPYYVQPDQEPWVDLIQMQEVVELETEEQPDKFTKATRETVPF